VKIIEPLNKSHEREQFDCGNEVLNQFLRSTARQHIQKGISRTFVLIDRDLPQAIISFFTLTLCEVKSEKLPPEIAKKYPSQVPGVKLARLAVDSHWLRIPLAVLVCLLMQKMKLLVDITLAMVSSL
jgi:hypothetical protein